MKRVIFFLILMTVYCDRGTKGGPHQGWQEDFGEVREENYKQLEYVNFEMPTYKYLRTGDIIGDCVKMGKAYGETLK